MPRARRAWSVMRAEIRRLLRETTGATSFWSDELLLDAFNHAIDLRAMQMGEAHEGWITQTVFTDLVPGQRNYALPEGTDRVKRVLLVFNEGGRSFETPLIRSERWSQPMFEDNNVAVGAIGTTPTYRLVANEVFLEPPPTEARVNGLKVELEAMPDRIVLDADKLDLLFPSVQETLLIYDAWDIAVGVEDAQGNLDDTVRGRLSGFHARLAKQWDDFIQVRSHGRVFSQGYYLGD